MPNTQTGPYPVLFAKNTTRARINLQTTVGGTHFRRSLGPGETKEVPWVIAKSAGFHRLWLDGKLEVSDKFDFSTTLDELPPIGAGGGPAQWEEIEGIPEAFPPAEHDQAWGNITGKPAKFPPEDHTHAWGDVTGKPTTFAPANHSHAITDVTGLQADLNGKAASSHDHTIANVTNLQTELNGKAASDHDHAIADVDGLQSALNGKAASTHTHTIANVTGLQDELDAKVATTDSRLSDARPPTAHDHSWGDITDKPATFAPTIGTSATTAVAGNDSRLTDSRTPKAHTHTWAEITDPPTIPDAAPVAEAQADSEAEDVATLVGEFNSLLAKLRAAGIIAS